MQFLSRNIKKRSNLDSALQFWSQKREKFLIADGFEQVMVEPGGFRAMSIFFLPIARDSDDQASLHPSSSRSRLATS